MHFYSVLSVLLVPIHIYLKRSHLKQPLCSGMIRVIQLNSEIIAVVKGNPKHPLKAIHNVQSSASPLTIKTKLHSENKKGSIQSKQMPFSPTTLLPLGCHQRSSKGLNSLPRVILS